MEASASTKGAITTAETVVVIVTTDQIVVVIDIVTVTVNNCGRSEAGGDMVEKSENNIRYLPIQR